ncbi:MAG: hypothetical protein ACM3QU_16185 [Verrucomicrobiota bacterium]
MKVRSPHLYVALRSFCLAAFAVLGREVERAGEIPFVVEEHGGLYEYRPLVRDRVEMRAPSLEQLDDARIAIAEVRSEPAAAIFAQGDAADATLFRAVLVPLLVATAEACGGFDWEDGAYNRAYRELEHSLYGTSRAYAAAAPLVGLSVPAPIDLGRGIQVRASGAAEILQGLPVGAAALPSRFGEEPERSCALTFDRGLPGGVTNLPDAPGELADAVTALRLATGAPVAAGPLAFEQLDGRPLDPRPVLGIAAIEPGGEATRLDAWRGRLGADLLERLASSEGDAALGEALERWELALFESEPLRSERLRESLAALLGGVDGLWAATMRAAILVGETSRDRAASIEGLRALARGERADDETLDTMRRVLVEVLLHEDRGRLVAALDDALVGLRPRPAGYFSAQASAA